MSDNTVLIVDDDVDIRELISDLLTQNGFSCVRASNTIEADSILKTLQPNLILLDIMMSGENGLSFCQRIRKKHHVPIIMISAVDSETEQVLAHEYGADDFVLKPFNANLLLAKVKRALNRSSGQETSIDDYNFAKFDQWQVDLNNRCLIKEDIRIDLSTMEYNLLFVFIHNANKSLSRDQLMQKIHNKDCDIYDRSIDVSISRLRKKIELDRNNPEIIKTVHSLGYIFTKKVEWL